MGMWKANMYMEMEEGPGNGPELTTINIIIASTTLCPATTVDRVRD